MIVSIILINWNQTAMTIRCVESIFQHSENTGNLAFQVIIVDNGSEATAVTELEDFTQAFGPSHVLLLKNDYNAGFAGGNNLGIRFALEQQTPDFIWLLNNDTIVQPKALNRLVEAATLHPQVKIWGSTIYELHPELHFHCAGGFRYNALLSIPNPLSIPTGISIENDIYAHSHPMDYPAGVSMFVRANVFRETGLMNENYFLYYEELDLVKQIGGSSSIAWCPASVLLHEAGQSTGSKNPNQGLGSYVAHYYGNLSALKYTWKYHKLYFPFVFIFRLSAKSFLFLKHRDLSAFPPLGKAYLHFFKWLFANGK